MALCKEYENIVGVKEASGNFSAIAQIASLSGGTVDIYSGNDDQTVPMMALGAKGQGPLPTDDQTMIATLGGLRKELEKLNQLAWQANEDTIR